jgi:hypothetical protein
MAEKTAFTTPCPNDTRLMPSAQMIGVTYEQAILACRREDEDQSVRAILLLQDAMRSVNPANSADLLRFYDLCRDRIQGGDFHIAALTLATLRDAWEKAL